MLDNKLNNTQKLIHPEVIASKEFNHNWSHQLRYGKHKYNGLGIIDYRVEQKVKQF